MKLVIQRVINARVTFEDGKYNEIDKGLLVYVGVHKNDNNLDIKKAVDKIVNLRIFENDEGKLHFSMLDKKYSILVISNFSLQGNLKKGNRPSFTESANHIEAEKIYNDFISYLRQKTDNIEVGKFKTDMKVHSINDGPLNLIFDTREGE